MQERPTGCSRLDHFACLHASRAEALGQLDVRVDDWTDDIAPFWTAVWRSALTMKGLKGIFASGPTTLKVQPSLVHVRILCVLVVLTRQQSQYIYLYMTNNTDIFVAQNQAQPPLNYLPSCQMPSVPSHAKQFVVPIFKPWMRCLSPILRRS